MEGVQVIGILPLERIRVAPTRTNCSKRTKASPSLTLFGFLSLHVMLPYHCDAICEEALTRSQTDKDVQS
jgi:hypothetical protein